MRGVVLSLLLALSGLAGRLFADQAAPGEGQFLSRTRQLTFDGKRSGEAYFSPDGKMLVFQSEREPENPFYQIYTVDLESGETHRISPGIGKTTCAFFRPGSDEVLFASTHLDPNAQEKQKAELTFRASGQKRRYSWDYDDQMDIFVAKRDGTNLRPLTRALGYDAEASYSPDGQKIVFTSLRNAYPPDKLSAEDRKRLETDPSYFGEIYIMNADGTDQRRLTFSPGYDGGPFFSPDGQRIVWRRFDPAGLNADVFTMRLDGSDVQRITDFGGMSWAPFFHPSGKYLIFTSNKLGFANFELFLVDANGRHEPVRVTYTEGFDGLPSFSPDGRRLCWTSTRTSDESSQLFLADWNHEAALAAMSAAPLRTQSVAPPASAEPPSVSDRHQTARDLEIHELRSEVSYLASDALEGRMTGSQGSHLAADYIADHLRKANISPFGDGSTYFQQFDFSAGVTVQTNENHLTVNESGSGRDLEFQPEKDFRPLAFTANGAFEGEIVFAGYGLSIPGDARDRYDSYTGLDVTNKAVLVLRYTPENVDPKRRQELNRYAGLRYKAMIAREHGAKAILVVTGPNSPNPGHLAELSFDTSLAGSGILAASISNNVADALLKSSGKSLSELQTALDTENPHAEGGFLISKSKVHLALAVQQVKKFDRNVIGEWAPPTLAAAGREYVLIGAHYDHLGFGESGAMLRQGEEGQVHHGADDNASGVAAVLELAKSFSEDSRETRDLRRGVIFAFWSGEELGLIGSTYFTEHPTVPLSNIVAYVNLDMVGRLRDNKLILQGIGSSTSWRRSIEKGNVAAGFNLVLQEDPYLPTDATAFYPKHIPVLNFFTGSHEDYHRPTDQADKIDYEGLARITEFSHKIIEDLVRGSNRLDYAKVTSSGMNGQRENLRAYLGTIPDYTTEVTGVKLSGVRSGSPAEKAGLKGGDVIVEFGGQQIKNIYDYTYALDAVKIGKSVPIVALRNGQRVSLEAIPEARK